MQIEVISINQLKFQLKFQISVKQVAWNNQQYCIATHKPQQII